MQLPHTTTLFAMGTSHVAVNRTCSTHKVTTKSATFSMSPNGIMTKTHEHQESSQHENEQITTTPPNNKLKTARLRSKLKKLPKSTSELIRSASTKVAQKFSKPFKGKSHLAEPRVSLLCDFFPTSRENETFSTNIESTHSNHVLSTIPDASLVSDYPEHRVHENNVNTIISNDDSAMGSNNSNTTVSVESVELLDRSADDPGVTPSPVLNTATSMEVCEWTTSREIAGDMAWICGEAAEGNIQMGIPRMASCLNRAINNHLYDLPDDKEVSLPVGATGAKDHYLMDGPKRVYPRGAMGLRRPLESDFPSWRHTPEGMVPVPRDNPHHWRFFPGSSPLRKVENVQYDYKPSVLANPCVTGRSLKRSKAMVSRQIGQQKTPEKLKEGDKGLMPILEEDEEEFEGSQKPVVSGQLAPQSPDDSDSTAGSSDNWQDLESGSENSDGEPSSEVSNNTIVRCKPSPLPQAPRAPLPRSAGCYNLNLIPEAIIEEEEEELPEQEDADSDLHPGFGLLKHFIASLTSGSDSEGVTSMNSFEVDWDAAGKIASLHNDSNSTESNDKSELEPAQLSQPEQVQHQPVRPAPVQFEDYDSDENDGRVFPWQRGVSKIVWRSRSQAAADDVHGSSGSEEEDEDIWAQQGLEESIASSGLSPVSRRASNSKAPANTSAHACNFSTASQDEILVRSYQADNESECDGDAFSINSGEIDNTDTEFPAVIPFKEESTVIHHSGHFGPFNPPDDQHIKLQAQTKEQLLDLMKSIEDDFDHDDNQILLPCLRPVLPIGVKYADEYVALIDEGPHLIVPEEDASMHFVVADSSDEEDSMGVEAVKQVERLMSFGNFDFTWSLS